MKKLLPLLILLLLVLLTFSCAESATTTTEEIPATPETPGVPEVAETPAPPQLESVAFVTRELRDFEDMMGPLVEVSVQVNGEAHLLDSVMAASPFEEDQYAQYQMPAEAVAGCGGWWAGAGDYFYAVEEENEVVVYAGWQDEMQEDEGFHYEKVKTIPIPGK